jgi:hypothetical protein
VWAPAADRTFLLRGCSTELPTHLVAGPWKRSRLFAGAPIAPDDPRGAYLKVSHHSGGQETFRSGEGEVDVPDSHVRFSVWIGDEAKCVISLPETEASDLAEFLRSELDTPVRHPIEH